MIRAAAKNHADVCVVVDPSDYEPLLEHLAGDSSSSDAQAFRRRLAWKAFQHCSSYDATVSEWLWNQIGAASGPRFCGPSLPSAKQIMIVDKSGDLHAHRLLSAPWLLVAADRIVSAAHGLVVMAALLRSYN